MWVFEVNKYDLNNSFKHKLKALLRSCGFTFLYMVKQKGNVCLCVFEKEKGRERVKKDFDSHELFYVFLFLKICLYSCFMRPLSPQAQSGSKKLGICP